jgi:hypothetical protein
VLQIGKAKDILAPLRNWNNQVKEYIMARAHSTYGREEEQCIQGFGGIAEGQEFLRRTALPLLFHYIGPIKYLI